MICLTLAITAPHFETQIATRKGMLTTTEEATSKSREWQEKYLLFEQVNLTADNKLNLGSLPGNGSSLGLDFGAQD